MELELFRKQNDYCYLYGSIYDGEEWLCDTLEFGSGYELKADTYILKNLICSDTKQKVIGIYNTKMELVAKMVKDNCQTYYNIKMRKENNNICVGFKVNTPLLEMYEHSFRILSSKITTCDYSGAKSIIHIRNIIK